MKKWIRVVVTVFAFAFVAIGITAYWAFRQTQYVPEFYRVAMLAKNELDGEPIRVLTERVSKRMEALQITAQRRGAWSTSFSNEEINAWLAQELPRKFPRLLRCGLSKPRVAIEEGKLMAAARFRNRRIDTIVSCEIKVELTEQANLLAIHLENLRAGALALPWSQFLDQISKEAAVGGIDVQWDMTERGPVALVQIPSEHPQFVVRPVLIESVLLQLGAISLSGRSGQYASSNYQPQSSMHRFVTYQPDPTTTPLPAAPSASTPPNSERRQAMLPREDNSSTRVR